jgi:hypothetical protein
LSYSFRLLEAVDSRPVPRGKDVPSGLAWTFLFGTASALIQGGPYGLEQGIAVERLAEERDGAGSQGSLACLVVAVSSQNDRRNSGTRARQVSEEVETIHSGHPEVEHQTTGLFLMDGLQEVFGGCERLYAEAGRSQEVPQGPTQRFVVVHDGNYRCVVFAHEFQTVGAGWEASTLLWWGSATTVRGDPEAPVAPDQFRQRPGPHLHHYLSALFLDRGFGSTELGGNLLVE